MGCEEGGRDDDGVATNNAATKTNLQFCPSRFKGRPTKEQQKVRTGVLPSVRNNSSSKAQDKLELVIEISLMGGPTRRNSNPTWVVLETSITEL